MLLQRSTQKAENSIQKLLKSLAVPKKIRYDSNSNVARHEKVLPKVKFLAFRPIYIVEKL